MSKRHTAIFWGGCAAIATAGFFGLSNTTPVPSVDGPAAVSHTVSKHYFTNCDVTGSFACIKHADLTVAPCSWWAKGTPSPARLRYTIPNECVTPTGAISTPSK